jgi:hypothetical protein
MHTHLFRALGPSPSTGTVTVTLPGGTTSDVKAWSIVEFSGVDTSGTNGSGAIVQAVSVRESNSGTTTLSNTLAAFSSAANATYACWGCSQDTGSAVTFTPGSGFTTLHSVNNTYAKIFTEWKAANDTTCDATTNLAVYGSGIALEIKAATANTLTADTRTVTVTANAANLVQRRLTASGGSFTVTGQAANLVPDEYTVHLSDFGGGPSQSLATNQTAFNNAIADLVSNGGGRLIFNPGTYSCGNVNSGNAIFDVTSANNIHISGYDCTLTMTTTDTSTPVFFWMPNASNSSISGFLFKDFGADITGTSANKGVIAIYIPSFQNCSNFTVKDCSTDNVTALVDWDKGAGASTNNTVEGCYIKNAYYGVMMNTGYGSSNASRTGINITCEGVRRALIAPAINNANVTINAIAVSGQPASNAFVSPVARNGETCANVDLTVNMSGNWTSFKTFTDSSNGGTVHLWHQGTNSTTVGPKYSNFNVTINVNNLTGTHPVLVCFSHFNDSSFIATTARAWENVTIQGTITGAFSGVPIRNTTTSTASGNSVAVSTRIRSDVSGLPSYFSSFTPPNPSYTMNAATASVAVSPVSAAMLRGHVMPAIPRNVLLTDFATQLLYHRRMLADVSAVNIAGILVQLGHPHRTLEVTTGSFSATGQNAEFRRRLQLLADSAAVDVTGFPISTLLLHLYTFAAECTQYFAFTPDAILRHSNSGNVTSQPAVREEGFRYLPSQPPQGVTTDEALRWVLQELERASIVMNNLADGKTITLHEPPSKLVDGMIRKADGTNWNPGAGAGTYVYDAGTNTWTKL